MLRGVTDKKEIKKLRNQLIARLAKIEDGKVNIRYSSKGGIGNIVEASYSEAYNFWWYFDGKEDQYWNPFGLGRPRDNQNVTGRCQINMPHEGLNRRIGGAFAKDEDGNIYLLHNGTVGGGITGINKTNFIKWYSGALNQVSFGDRSDEYYVVAEFSARNFYDQILFFVQQVYLFKDEFKATVLARIVKASSDKWLKHGESLFRNPFSLPQREVIRGANHAIIANALMDELNRTGHEAFRNRLMDTFIVGKGGKVTHLFEVKSTLTTQSLYTAIGQLVVYNLKHQAVRILVVEHTTRPDLIENLHLIGIRCLKFEWKRKLPVFIDLDTVLV